MRVALISDIHGNLVSFKAVLADISLQKVNEIIFLGDIANLGPQPHECVQLLKSLGCPCVIGNHETYLFRPDLGHAYMRGTRWFHDTLTWCRASLTPEDYKFLRTFRPMIRVNMGDDQTLLCFHGSPRSNTDNIFSTTPHDVMEDMLAGHRATVMAGGHTHVQMMRQYDGYMIVNSGSVGMPFEQMPFAGDGPRMLPWAEYAIVSCTNGAVGVDLRRVPVDMEAVKQAAYNQNLPPTSDWLNNWVDWEE